MCRTTLSRPIPVVALVSRYLTNKLIGHEPLSDRRSFARRNMRSDGVIGYYRHFRKVFRLLGRRRYPRVWGTLSMNSSPVRH